MRLTKVCLHNFRLLQNVTVDLNTPDIDEKKPADPTTAPEGDASGKVAHADGDGEHGSTDEDSSHAATENGTESLDDVEQACFASTTILVGPNNSGKTSVAEAFQLFVAREERRFAINDFSLSCRRDFADAEALIGDATSPEGIALLASKLPHMHMDLHFRHTDSDADIAVVWDLLMNLDEMNRVAVRVEFAPKDVEKLAADYRTIRKSPEPLFAFLSRRLGDYYGLRFYKLDPVTGEVHPLASRDALDRIVRVDFLFAQRYLDDQEGSRALKLSHLLHDHYEKHHSKAEPEKHDELDQALTRHTGELSIKYDGSFEPLKRGLRLFGTSRRHGPPAITVKAELNSETLFRDNTKIFYRPFNSNNGLTETPLDDPELQELPEKYNGLGYKNLVYMTLQIQSYRMFVEKNIIPRPRIHLLFIEEPETHLHPQVQTVFLKRLFDLLNQDTPADDVQVMITTHSPHVVAECGFKPIRYFRNRGGWVEVKDLLRFQEEMYAKKKGKGKGTGRATNTSAPGDACDTAPGAKRAKQQDVGGAQQNLPDGSGTEALRFLRKYLSLTHCDLFFANEAIIVEGPSERLLLPAMIARYVDDCNSDFGSEYVTILEVGGAYAHKFRELLKFIDIPTLIITDLDSIDADGKACKVNAGVTSSNPVLTSWLPRLHSLPELLGADDAQKVDGCIRVAYQKAAPESTLCGRSFEEAFIYENVTWLLEHRRRLFTTGDTFINCANELEVLDRAFNLIPDKKKTNFALDLMVEGGWTTPTYILEGLKWLASFERPQS